MEEPTWISKDSPGELERLLKDQLVLVADARMRSLAPAGEGNMNVTLRAELVTEGVSETLIVKQSRPYVAKYDSIPAPIERIEYEAAFYRQAAQVPSVRNLLPELIAWLPQQYILILEDLGAASDATFLYNHAVDATKAGAPEWIEPLVHWLGELHRSTRGKVDVLEFCNLKLRTLNHAHIFEIPFSNPPGIDLDSVCPGLTQASEPVRCNAILKASCARLGAVYLADGDCLLHGDFYPGSWLILPEGPRVIDPEFCFAGPAEFDLGVMLAHLQLSGIDRALDALTAFASEDQATDWELVKDFAAVEVLRRILGVAQLPLPHKLDQRMALVESAASRLTGSSGQASRSA